MKPITTTLLTALFSASCTIASHSVLANSAADADGTPTVLTNLQFNSSTLGAAGWTFGAHNGATISVSTTAPPPGIGASPYALEGAYPAATTGSWYVSANYSVAALNIEDIYIEFWAKMPDAKEGLKFVKIFGKGNDPVGYANTTIGTNFTGGADQGGILAVGFGDGTATANDAQNAIFLSGAGAPVIGRSYGTATVLTPQHSAFTNSDWGTSWHHFRIHVKFNSGTNASDQIPDGEVYLEIDGRVYADATGLYNRNPGNGPINYIGFFGWAQTDPSPFDVWYDNIRISTGGFLSAPIPSPPENLRAN